MSSSSPLRHDLSPSLPNPTKRGRNHPRLPEPTLTAVRTAATPSRRDSPATDCLPLTPHGLVCKTPVTTHACLLGRACTASRRCLLLPKAERPRVWCTQHLSKSSGLPHISTHTSDHNIDATRSTSTGRRDCVPAAAAADKPPSRRALNRIVQPAPGRSPFQASATARPPRAGASPAKAANSSPHFRGTLNFAL